MQIWIFRHAERDAQIFNDPPLSLRGTMQSQHLVSLVQKKTLPTPDKIFSSPLQRALMTFQPLSGAMTLPLQKTSDLSEKQNLESKNQFALRIHHYLDHLTTSLSTYFLVTHLDWIEEALHYFEDNHHLGFASAAWAPGQYLGLEISESQIHLISRGVL